MEKLDNALLLWFYQEHSKGKPISGPTLKEKAVQLHQKMDGDDDFQSKQGVARGDCDLCQKILKIIRNKNG